VNPGGESGWDEPPLDIQIPDDARELDRDVLAYRRELRAMRRRSRMRKLAGPFAGQGTLMPLLASILAVCLVAGAMLSVATFSPTTGRSIPRHPSATVTSSLRSGTARSSAGNSASASATGVRPSGRGGTAQPSGAANSPAPSSPPASQVTHTIPPGGP
jgi:hypothetical protein